MLLAGWCRLLPGPLKRLQGPRTSTLCSFGGTCIPLGQDPNLGRLHTRGPREAGPEGSPGHLALHAPGPGDMRLALGTLPCMLMGLGTGRWPWEPCLACSRSQGRKQSRALAPGRCRLSCWPFLGPRRGPIPQSTGLGPGAGPVLLLTRPWLPGNVLPHAHPLRLGFQLLPVLARR